MADEKQNPQQQQPDKQDESDEQPTSGTGPALKFVFGGTGTVTPPHEKASTDGGTTDTTESPE